MSKVIELSKQLIEKCSISPEDAGCQELLIKQLKSLGFQTETYQHEDVTNLWARYGEQKPLFVFLGHTDVVPPGPLDQWNNNPFQPEVRNGYLYGRGAADMKSSVAAMVCACENFLKDNPNPSFSIAFLITSDEEAQAINGTRKMAKVLQDRNEVIDYCLVGEPGSQQQVGDQIKIGRRGSLHGYLKILGKQGHIAYPDKATNPIHRSFKALQALIEQSWDINPNEHFPPTSMQISNVHGGVGADNVIPGEFDVQFNFRFSTATHTQYLQDTVHAVLEDHQLNYKLDWRLSGEPFLTSQGALLEAVDHAVQEIIGVTPKHSTAGGTSDGRFIAPMGSEIIELGICNETIHQINECGKVSDIENLVMIYEKVLENLARNLEKQNN